MADIITNEKIISLGTLSHNNNKIKEYIQGEIDKIPSSTVDDALSDTSEHPVQNKVVNTALKSKADKTYVDEALNGKANKTDIPTSLPADGGNADTVDGKHAADLAQNFGYWKDAKSIKDYIADVKVSGFCIISSLVTDMPVTGAAWMGVINCSNGSKQITAYKIGSNKPYAYSMTYFAPSDTWYDWVCLADGGNAATVNGHTVNSDVPANAKFTDTTYRLATSAANGLMSANDKLKLNYTNIAYATCDTAADTSAKVATISGNTAWSLAVGSIVTVKFSVTNTASNCTLNVNGTGAKQIWYHNGVYTGNSASVSGVANSFITYMYDGTYWIWIGHSLDSTPGYASATAAGIVSTGTQHFAGYKIFPTKIAIKTTGTAGTQPTSDINSAMYFTNTDVNASFGEIRNCIRSSSVTTGEVFTSIHAYSNDRTGSNTIKVVATNNNSGNYITISNPTIASSVSCLRKLSSGTAEATWDSTNSTGNCPPGAWYGKHS